MFWAKGQEGEYNRIHYYQRGEQLVSLCPAAEAWAVPKQRIYFAAIFLPVRSWQTSNREVLASILA